MQITTRTETVGITNTALNIVKEAITALITMNETNVGEVIASILKKTGTIMITEPITMKEEIIMTIPSMEGCMKDLSINLMC